MSSQVVVLVVLVGVGERILGEVGRVVRLLLGQQLVQGFAFGLLVGGDAVAHPGRPPLGRGDAPVQRVVAGICAEGV